MKIGFSFGKCVRDIVTGKVKLDDVMVVVSATSIPDESKIAGVVESYMYSSSRLEGLDYDECLVVATELYKSGRLHQPRLFNGGWRGGVEERFVWMDLHPTVQDDQEMVRDAWDHYRMMLHLIAGQIPPADEVPQNIIAGSNGYVD